MKKHNEIVESQNDFFKRREDFLNLNAELYLNLINQIVDKMEIPKGKILTFKNGTDTHINVVEEWLNIEEDESCRMKIDILIGNSGHYINFASFKNQKQITLSVTLHSESKEFEYDISKFAPKDINLDDIIDFISESLTENYEKWTFGI